MMIGVALLMIFPLSQQFIVPCPYTSDLDCPKGEILDSVECACRKPEPEPITINFQPKSSIITPSPDSKLLPNPSQGQNYMLWIVLGVSICLVVAVAIVAWRTRQTLKNMKHLRSDLKHHQIQANELLQQSPHNTIRPVNPVMNSNVHKTGDINLQIHIR